MRAARFISIPGHYFTSIESLMLLKDLIVVNFFCILWKCLRDFLHPPPEYLRLIHQAPNIIRFLNNNCKLILYSKTLCLHHSSAPTPHSHSNLCLTSVLCGESLAIIKKPLCWAVRIGLTLALVLRTIPLFSVYPETRGFRIELSVVSVQLKLLLLSYF